MEAGGKQIVVNRLSGSRRWPHIKPAVTCEDSQHRTLDDLTPQVRHVTDSDQRIPDTTD